MTCTQFQPDGDFAHRLDAADELRRFRDAFEIRDPDLVYLDGNSLGRLPRRTVPILEHVIREEWGSDLIRGWAAGWFEAPERIGGKLAEILGARPHEVLISDSTSVNLFKLTMAALRARPGRKRIVSDDLNSPPTYTWSKVPPSSLITIMRLPWCRRRTG